MNLKQFQPTFERALSVFLQEKRRSVRLTKDPFLLDLIRYPEKLLAGGKRVRPYIASLMLRAAGGVQSPAVMRVLLALEIFHLFGLMHDDIIDHGTSRHGVATLHVHAAEKLREQKRWGELARIGEAQALLMGDMLFSWSTELLIQSKAVSPRRMEAARHVFFRMVEEVIVGQMVDVDLTTRHMVSEELVMDKMRLKTASYTFIRPLEIGAALAGGLPRYATFCRKLGLALGLAFQIQDDLLDLTIPYAQSKKTTLSDLSEHQHTLFTQYIFDHGTKREAAELASLMGKKLTEKDRSRVVKLFTDSGAIAHGTRIIDRQFALAQKLIVTARFPEAIHQEFESAMTLIQKRAS